MWVARNLTCVWLPQGSVVTFNVFAEDGAAVSPSEFSRLAGLRQIQVRTGCVCNVGACQLRLGKRNRDVMDRYEVRRHVLC